MDPRWSKVRNAFIFVFVVSLIYFLALPTNHRGIQTVNYGVKLNPSQNQRFFIPTPISVQEIEERGNFSVWANTKFSNNGPTFNQARGGSKFVEKPFSETGRRAMAKPQFFEDVDDTSSYESSGSSDGGVVATMKKSVLSGQYTERSSREKIEEERKSFSMSDVFPLGGNTLPNFYLHGLQIGLSPSDYQRGVVAFLHHNKAAGSSIKVCLNMMVNRGVLRNHSLLVLSSKILSLKSMDQILKHDTFVGGYTFWLCENFGERNCSYFTILRDPYDRVLSSYFYCKVQYWDQLCGPLGVGNFTIEQWAIYQGSYFFHQLLMDKKYCGPNKVIDELFKYEMYDQLIPPGTDRYITLKKTQMCWFKQRLYLNTFVKESDKELLLQNVLDNLETWFSVIGLTEEFDLSLKMLSVAYDLPFYRRCRGKIRNRSPSGSDDESQTRERLKMQLKLSPAVAEALRYDIRIYEAGKDIFRRQNEQLEILSTHNGKSKRRKTA